jgi:NNP family nitrate/nitrite transporter-like MFS transporter
MPAEVLATPRPGAAWLTDWRPEDETFWREQGSRIAWRTLIITTFSLLLAFSTWFVVSAIVVRLPVVGFTLTTTQLFWLAAMPGLAAGTLRIAHTFLIPIFGSRTVIAVSTLLLLAPVIGWTMAVQNPQTPYWVLLLLAFLAGLGGGNFSSFMPSTSLFFPKRLQGTALGVQAGIGNFGVSVVQFVTPWVIGFALLGGLLGGAQVTPAGGRIWLQNAAAVYAPLILVATLAAWAWLRSIPIRANFRQQLDIFKDPHTWTMTSLYIMTFGSFSGLSASFPLLIRELYGHFEGAPDPLAYAFLGPLVGSAVRVASGPLADRLGGARLTHYAGIGLLAGAIGVTWFTRPDSLATFTWFVLLMLAMFFFSGIGNASTFKQMPMIFPPRQAGGVLGWTAAIAAYGPFIFASLIAWAIAATGSPNPFFIGAAVFYALNVALNWWFYARRGAPRPC